jgi:hypothetical protein
VDFAFRTLLRDSSLWYCVITMLRGFLFMNFSSRTRNSDRNYLVVASGRVLYTCTANTVLKANCQNQLAFSCYCVVLLMCLCCLCQSRSRKRQIHFRHPWEIRNPGKLIVEWVIVGCYSCCTDAQTKDVFLSSG